MLKQQLQQRLQQKLSPQQIQTIKMLEIPTLELEERIRQELEENPALEEGRDELEPTENEQEIEAQEEFEGEEFDFQDYLDEEDDIPEYRLRTDNYSQEEQRRDMPFSAKDTFHEHLLGQLGEMDLPKAQAQLVEYIIGNIDDEGYLRREVEQMVDDLAFHLGLTVAEKELEAALAIVQEFEPAGVGARTLQESLLIQLSKRAESKVVVLARRIIKDFFEEFSRKQYDKIARRLNLTQKEIAAALGEILRLNPKPGNAWGGGAGSANEQIVPDFTIVNENGTLLVQLNGRNMPELHVSRVYQDMIQDYAASKANRNAEMRSAVFFAKQKIDSARWFIDAIRQRNATMLAVMEAILKFQRDFFLTGDELQLRPMILKDIAEITGYDVSTVSRVGNSKFAETEFGIFPLKFFFSESMMTDSGEEISSREIKRILKENIDAEDKRRPVTDDKLTEILNAQGYLIARRTVAKYREQIGIPVARLRKKF